MKASAGTKAVPYQPRTWEGVAGVVHLLMHGRAMCRGKGLRLSKYSEDQVLAVSVGVDGELSHYWLGFNEGCHGMNAVPVPLRCVECWRSWCLWWEESDETDDERMYLQQWHRDHGLLVSGKPNGRGQAPASAPPADLGGARPILSAGSQAELDALLGSGLTFPSASAPTIIATSALPPDVAELERYLGIDPGLANLGVFVLGLSPTGVRCLHRETFATTPEHGTDDQRLRLIARRMDELVGYWRPTAIGYEDVRSITTGKETRRTGHSDSGPLLMVCGIVIATAWQHGDVPCYRVANASARMAVLGKGKTRGSSKATVRDRVQEITGTRKLTLDQGDAGAFAFGAYVKHRPPPTRKKKR